MFTCLWWCCPALQAGFHVENNYLIFSTQMHISWHWLNSSITKCVTCMVGVHFIIDNTDRDLQYQGKLQIKYLGSFRSIWQPPHLLRHDVGKMIYTLSVCDIWKVQCWTGSLPISSGFQWFRITVMIRITSFKMADKISRNDMTIQLLKECCCSDDGQTSAQKHQLEYLMANI